MANFKSFEMEDIAYKEWSDHLDLVASTRVSPWLPAYGFEQPTTLQDMLKSEEDSYAYDNPSMMGQQYIFLETIVEETSDDLRSESDRSGPAGWNSDSDTESVIHMPKITELSRPEWKGSDRELFIPKKRRKRLCERPSLSDDDEPPESNSISSRSSSLIAFESLEKHVEDVYRSISYTDNTRWQFTSSPDGYQPQTFSSDEDSSDDTLQHSISSYNSFKSNDLKTYKSFDSLNLLQHNSLSYSLSELSQSHSALDIEKEKEQEEEVIIRDKKLSATTADLSIMTDLEPKTKIITFNKRNPSLHEHNKRYSLTETIENELILDRRKAYSSEGLKYNNIEQKETKAKPQHSAENLSEDSGFGDHINKTNLSNFRSSVSSIPEDSAPETSSESYYSDCSSSNNDDDDDDDDDESYSGNECTIFKTSLNHTNDCACNNVLNNLREEVEEEGASSLPTRSIDERSIKNEANPHRGLVFSEFKCDDNTNMAGRLPVVSTPNLYIEDDEFRPSYHQFHAVPSAASSLTHVPLKCDDDIDNNIQRLNILTGSQPKGVHFCPVVSEVSWRDSYSDDSSSDNGGNSSDPSTDEMCNRSLEDLMMAHEEDDEDEDEDEEEEPVTHRLELVITSDNKDINEMENKQTEEPYATPVSYNTPTNHVIQPYVDTSSVVDVPRSTEEHTTPGFDNEFTTMESNGKKQKSKLSGFFDRFNLRRLSGRVSKKQKKQNKSESVGVSATTTTTTDDVVIIPLHAPDEVKLVTSNVLSTKPPLPPLPPRMTARKRPSNDVISPGIISNGLQNSTMPGARGDTTNNPGITKKNVTNNNNYTKQIYPSEQSVGLLETDLDTDITVQSIILPACHTTSSPTNKKARSLMNLGLSGMSIHPDSNNSNSTISHLNPTIIDDRAKSMEFLLDKENQAAVLPPENELQKVGVGGERVMSEHELRVQRSLQKLNVPEWYKNSAVSQTPQGFLLKRNSDAGSTHHHWPGLGSKTTSLSSLGSSQSAAARSPTSHILSPSPTPHLFTRWSTSRLNSGGTSTSTSPCGSARSSFNYRQPYLGWRSQERISKPRTPAERLAAGILPQYQQQQQQYLQNQQQPSTPNLSEVRTSIKEVTSAIVHYVSGVNENGSRETLRNYYVGASPRWGGSSPSRSSTPRGSSGKLCWLESSFVGSRPLDQPETPLTLSETQKNENPRSNELYLTLNSQKGNNFNSPLINGEYLLA